MMIRLLLILIMSIATITSVEAQSFCGPTSTYLACQFPFSVRTFGPKTTAFNSTFAIQLSQLPIASAASGFTLTLDKSLGIYTASAGSLGPVLAQRGDTIGKHKLFLAFSYQRFQFNSIDGVSIDHTPSIETGRGLPLVFFIPDPNLPNTTIYGQTENRIDTHVDQYVALATFGVTSRVDLSLAIPIQRIAIAVSTSGVEHFVNNGPPQTAFGTVPFTQYVPGSASGIGDVVVGAKVAVFQREKMSLALGTDIRFATGDEKNFLGSGAFGLKPYLAFSLTGRISPHFNVGYQWNSFSTLLPAAGGGDLQLPASINYAAGADLEVVKRMTVAADLIGTRFSNAPRVRPTTTGIPDDTGQLVPTPDLLSYQDSYHTEELALGIKVNPVGKLLLYGNVLLKLNDAGLRAKYIPLAGISYKF